MDDHEIEKYFENGEDDFSNKYDDESEEEDEEESEVVTVNDEYELEKEEPQSKSAEEFSEFLHSTEYPDDIVAYFKTLKLFQRDEKTRDIIPTKSLTKTVQGFCLYLFGTKRIPRPVIRGIAKIFGKYDIFHYISSEFAKRAMKLRENRMAAWFNLFNFMNFIPHPVDKVKPPLFPKFCRRSPFNNKEMRRRKLTWIANDWEKVWISIMTGNINSKLSLKMIPYISGNVIQRLQSPFKSADFFFKMFDKSDVHAILSLGAIFKLITEHNFEYPKFYEKVYSLTRPSLFYMDQKETVLTLLDSFLSSSHIPIYVVASFIKRFCRCLLYAPVDSQEPILGMVKNLMVRHPNCAELVHREVPKTFSEDPFDDEEPELHKTKALESSLWELKLLKSHWNQNIRKRAHFIDKPLQKMESYVRFRSINELFSVNMTKSFGGEDGDAEKFRKLQDGDDDEEDRAQQPPLKKPRRKGAGKFAIKHEEEEKTAKPVSINSVTPPSVLDRKMSNIDVPIIWKL